MRSKNNRRLPLMDALELRQLLSAGALDGTFGAGGKVLTDAGMDGAYVVSVRPDGKVLVAAGDDHGKAVRLARYDADGSLDTTYGGGDGLVGETLGHEFVFPADVTVLPDGKAVVVGTTSDGNDVGYFVARFNADGSVDTSFGDGGLVEFPITFFDGPPEATSYGNVGGIRVAAQADGKLVVARGVNTAFNDGDTLVVRLTADGDLDTTFGTGGVVTVELNGAVESPADMLVDADGRIVLAVDGQRLVTLVDGVWQASTDEYVLRLNADGSADGSFGVGGVVTEHAATGTINGYKLTSDDAGRLLLTGETMGVARDVTNFVIRYESDGDRDATFGLNGKVLLTVPGENGEVFGTVLPLSDGKVLVSGGVVPAGQTGNDGYSALTVRRLNEDGSLDTSYGAGGQVRYEIAGTRHSGGGAMAVDAAGRVVVAGGAANYAGKSDALLVRLEGEPAVAAGVRRRARAVKVATKAQKRAAAAAEAAQLAKAARRERKALKAARVAAKAAKAAKAARRARKLAAAAAAAAQAQSSSAATEAQVFNPTAQTFASGFAVRRVSVGHFTAE